MSQEKTTALAPIVAPGQVARQEFGAQQLAASGETASSAAAAQATALVQARYIMAIQRPRDWDDVRVRLMREVERPGFAEVAWFRKPIGAGVEGLSIRFAEAAMRCMGNLLPEAPVIYDDPARRILRVTLTDLESNLTWTKDVVIEKTVERRSLRRGQVAILVRTNSAGETTYLVNATEDELGAKEGAVVSKTIRTLALRILPGDLQDEARRRILEIRAGAAAKDPDAARRKIVDAFAGLNVPPPDLKRYLGHDVSTASPKELTDLRDLYSAIHAGEATWADALAERLGDQEEAPAPAKAGLDGVTEKLEAKGPDLPTWAEKAASAPSVRDGKRGDPDPAKCEHPAVKFPVEPGRILVCVDCGTDIHGGPPAEEAREPGSDDGPAAVEDIKKLAARAGDTTKAAPKQGRLKED